LRDDIYTDVDQVVSVPTTHPSAIQLAAAKRAILCELLVSAKVSHRNDSADIQLIQFPRYTGSSVVRAIERGAAEYTKLAKMFEAQDWKGVTAVEGTQIIPYKNVRGLDTGRLMTILGL
jgi:COP9 signalosome complex subunit 3